MDVVGKVMVRIIEDRLKLVAEDVVADFQCGFTAGRDVEMIKRRAGLVYR